MLTIDDFISEPRLREVDTKTVNAPAVPTFQLASHFDLASSPLVHALFWLRTQRTNARDQPLSLCLLGRAANALDLWPLGHRVDRLRDGPAHAAGAQRAQRGPG
jgi:hypothetical protein